MLSKRIRELRFSLGLNQVQFGQALNVTKQTISNLEKRQYSAVCGNAY